MWCWRRRRRAGRRQRALDGAVVVASGARPVCRCRCWSPAGTRRRCGRRPAGTGRLSQHGEADWAAVVRTAALHRTQFGSRAAVSARDASEAVEALRALAEGRPHAAVSIGEAKGDAGKLAFLFTGQGAQQLGMGRALLQTCAAFRAAFEEACGHFDELLELPLRAVMFAEEGSEAAELDQTAYAQPALFAVEVALFRQLEQWGITPDILLGHSIGELAAAHVCGRVVAQGCLPGGGGAWPADAGAARGRRHGGAGGKRGGGAGAAQQTGWRLRG